MDHLSVSQINLYMLCSLKYRFLYIDELPKPFRPAALAFGSAIHAALDWYHNQMMRNGKTMTLEKLCKIFEADWYAQCLDTKILYNPGEEETHFNFMGREILRLYFASPETEIKDSEVSFAVPLADPITGEELGINLEGFIDLVIADDNIVEFKTSGQTMTSKDVDNHLQLTAYSYAYDILYQRPARSLKIVDFVKARKPKMVALETIRTSRDHQRFFCLAKAVLNAIRSKIFLPRAGYWCRDCEYALECKAWKGN